MAKSTEISRCKSVGIVEREKGGVSEICGFVAGIGKHL